MLGAGTPDDPGGDFSMFCWIEADSPEAALNWGYRILGDYYRQRFAFSDSADIYKGDPIEEGEIETDENVINDAMTWGLPTCRVGQCPEWDRPWRICNINKTKD